MTHPTKKPWIKPEVKRFQSPEELLAIYRSKGSVAERQKLEELVDQARDAQARSLPQRKLRRNSNG